MSTRTLDTYTPPGYTAPESPNTTAREREASTSQPTDSARAWLANYFGSIFGDALQEEAQATYEVFLRTGSEVMALDYLRNTAGYKARFAGMAALRERGRPISEAAYLDLERSYTQIARQFDLPPGFYDDPSDFGKLIGSEVSPMEYQRRLGAWQTYERQSRSPEFEAEVRSQFAALGLSPSDGDFLAAVIDPERGVDAIERRLNASLVGAEARRSGFGALAADQALSLADQGVTQDQARQGFSVLSDSTELFGGLAGEAGADTIGREEQLGAVFTGDSASRRRIERQRNRRTAEFGGDSSGGVGRSGLAGLG